MNNSIKNYFLMGIAVLFIFVLMNFMSGSVSSGQLQQKGLDYYSSITGETADDAVVRNYGCHREILIYRDGEVIMRLGYTFGRLFES